MDTKVTPGQCGDYDQAYSWLLAWVSREAAARSQQLSLRTEWEEEDGGRVSAR